MKKAMIILSVFFLSFSCYAQKFIDPTNVWIVEGKGDGMDGGLPAISSVYYKFFGDTVVSNKTYTKLYSSTKQDQSDWKLNALWREDKTGKLFQIIFDDYEVPKYDFNLTVGDTMKNNHEEMDAIVDSVVVKPFGSANKKYLYLHLIDVPSHILTWVDGVGSLFDPNIPDDYWVTGGTSKLICFEENGVMVYHNSDYPNCFLTSSININGPTEAFKVYPNPVFSELFVRSHQINDGAFTLELYSAKGELVKNECLEGGSNLHRIDVSSLKSGVYIVRLISSSGKYFEEIIIKK